MNRKKRCRAVLVCLFSGSVILAPQVALVVNAEPSASEVEEMSDEGRYRIRERLYRYEIPAVKFEEDRTFVIGKFEPLGKLPPPSPVLLKKISIPALEPDGSFETPSGQSIRFPAPPGGQVASAKEAAQGWDEAAAETSAGSSTNILLSAQFGEQFTLNPDAEQTGQDLSGGTQMDSGSGNDVAAESETLAAPTQETEPVATVASAAPPASAVTTTPDANEIPCDVTTIRFAINRAEPTADEVKQLLEEMASCHKRGDIVSVEVAGYTCDIGTQEYNDQLALQRAQAVATVLRTNGYTVNAVTGHGKADYLGPIPESRDLNRRVEITVRTRRPKT